MAQHYGKEMETRIRTDLNAFGSQVQDYVDAGNQRCDTKIKHNEEILNSIQQLQSVQSQNTETRLKDLQDNIYKVTELLYQTFKESIDSQEKSLNFNIIQLNDKLINTIKLQTTETIKEIMSKHLAQEQNYKQIDQELALQR